MYNGTEIKQYENVKYLGCILDQSLSGESMALKVIDKVTSRLKFLHKQKTHFLTAPSRRLLCKALIQTFFDYPCTDSFLNLSKRVKLRYLKFIVSDIFKFYNNQCPDYFHELFCAVGKNSVITRSSNKKLKLPFRKTKLGIQSIFFVGPNT